MKNMVMTLSSWASIIQISKTPIFELILQSKDVDFNCKTCILAKSHKTSYYASLNKSNIPCALIL
jgi:hypothetical protein